MNRGWRFCRFNGVVNRVVSCWSLVCPAPPFYLVLGPYWTTFGLRLPVIAPTAILLLSPSARPVRGRTLLLRFVTRIPDLIRRDERSLECICCAGPQPSGFGVPLVSGRTPGGELSGRFESQAYNQLNLSTPLAGLWSPGTQVGLTTELAGQPRAGELPVAHDALW